MFPKDRNDPTISCRFKIFDYIMQIGNIVSMPNSKPFSSITIFHDIITILYSTMLAEEKKTNRVSSVLRIISRLVHVEIRRKFGTVRLLKAETIECVIYIDFR